MLPVALGWFARLWPFPVSVSDELDRATRTLDVEVAPETIVRAGYGAGILLGLVGIPLLVVAPGVPAVAVVGATALGTTHAIHQAPVLLARARRRHATGRAAALLGRATVRMRIAPAVEPALAFAARGEGVLAASLAAHRRRAAGTPTTGIDGFTEEWEPWSPSLTRSLRTLAVAGTLPPADRDRTLDRARRTFLDGVRDRAATEAARLRVPVTALYALGVFLPLALVGILPAAAAAGARIPVWMVVVGFDLVLPVALTGAAIELVTRRPTAFPPPRITREHPSVPDRRWPPVLAGIATGTAGGAAATVVLPAWTVPPAALGSGLGTALVLWARPLAPVRERVRAVEADLPDAMTLVGRRVASGTAIEVAIADVAGDVGGETGAILARAARLQRRLGADVEPAFLGEYGALARIPSQRARDAAHLFVVASRAGRPAGDALVDMATHLAELREVDRESRRALRRITATLSQTATAFGPLVAGATVALVDGVGAGGVTVPLRTGTVGTALGLYVLALAVILAGLATGLERGVDRTLIYQRAGRALLGATVTFLGAFWVGRLLT